MSTTTNTQIISDASARNQVLNIDLIVEITGGMDSDGTYRLGEATECEHLLA